MGSTRQVNSGGQLVTWLAWLVSAENAFLRYCSQIFGDSCERLETIWKGAYQSVHRRSSATYQDIQIKVEGTYSLIHQFAHRTFDLWQSQVMSKWKHCKENARLSIIELKLKFWLDLHHQHLRLSLLWEELKKYATCKLKSKSTDTFRLCKKLLLRSLNPLKTVIKTKQIRDESDETKLRNRSTNSSSDQLYNVSSNTSDCKFN